MPVYKWRTDTGGWGAWQREKRPVVAPERERERRLEAAKESMRGRFVDETANAAPASETETMETLESTPAANGTSTLTEARATETLGPSAVPNGTSTPVGARMGPASAANVGEAVSPEIAAVRKVTVARPEGFALPL